MRILLTGADGNLGQTIKRKAQDHEVISITRANWKDAATKLKAGDVVIHAASDLRTPVSENPSGVMESNLMTTVDLLKAMDKARPSRFIFISSCAVYGQSETTSEGVPPAPISTNGVTKLLNEKIIAEYCEPRKLDYTILRTFNTFGGNDRFSIIHHLQKSVEKGVPFKLNNQGLSQRDFVFVEDLAAITLQLLDKKPADKILNVGSGEATKIRDIVMEFQKLHPKLEIVHQSRKEAEYSRADISRLREIFPDYQFRSVLDFLRKG